MRAAFGENNNIKYRFMNVEYQCAHCTSRTFCYQHLL